MPVDFGKFKTALKEVEHQYNVNQQIQGESQLSVKTKYRINHSGCRCRLGSVTNILSLYGCKDIINEVSNNEYYWTFNYQGDLKVIEDKLLEGGFDFQRIN